MKYVITRCGGWRGIAKGAFEGLMLTACIFAAVALMFALAPLAGR